MANWQHVHDPYGTQSMTTRADLDQAVMLQVVSGASGQFPVEYQSDGNSFGVLAYFAGGSQAYLAGAYATEEDASAYIDTLTGV